MTARRQLGISVLEAAQQRIALTFDAAERVYLSFSAGKDSTVMLHLVAAEARRRGRRFGLLLIDLEAQYRHTMDHAARCFAEYADCADPYWVSLPLNLRNAVSMHEPQWMCWDPDRCVDWVREPPAIAITDETRFPFFRRRMEFEDFVPQFAEWYSEGRPTACFVGIRTQESLNRWRTINSQLKVSVNGWSWTTRVSSAAWNVYPIYDWHTEDIWTWHARNPAAHRNEIYDLMHRAGLTIHQARICQPYGDDQRRGLWLFHLLEPETWGRVVARVNGANQGAIYCGEAGNILGNQKVTRPEGHTWESFAGLLLDSMPGPTAEHYRTKIAVFLEWWRLRGYEHGIPDEIAADAEARKEAPSWRRICKALLRNDYWCKGLSFSQHKDTSSYARYRALQAKRRGVLGEDIGPGADWSRRCGEDLPGKPTGRQLAFLAALTGGSTPLHGWTALARRLGVTVKAAQRSATRSDAATAIEALRESEAAMEVEQYRFRPVERQGDRSAGLAGEGVDHGH